VTVHTSAKAHLTSVTISVPPSGMTLHNILYVYKVTPGEDFVKYVHKKWLMIATTICCLHSCEIFVGSKPQKTPQPHFCGVWTPMRLAPMTIAYWFTAK